jgi:hypothetical protein
VFRKSSLTAHCQIYVRASETRGGNGITELGRRSKVEHPICEQAADAVFLKLQRLKNIFLRAIGNLDRPTPVGDLHVAFKIPYVYLYVTNLCRKQSEVIQNHVNPNVRTIGQDEAIHREHKRLKLGCGQAYDRSSD